MQFKAAEMRGEAKRGGKTQIDNLTKCLTTDSNYCNQGHLMFSRAVMKECVMTGTMRVYSAFETLVLFLMTDLFLLQALS